MTATELAAALIRQHEGERLFVYDDATGEPIVAGYTLKGHPSLGYGRNLAARGISPAESQYLLRNDLDEARETAEEFVGVAIWSRMTSPRKAALMDAAHALGPVRLAGFKMLRAAIQAGNWPAAAAQLLDSKWQRDMASLGSPRVATLAKILETGEMPNGMA